MKEDDVVKCLINHGNSHTL